MHGCAVEAFYYLNGGFAALAITAVISASAICVAYKYSEQNKANRAVTLPRIDCGKHMWQKFSHVL